MSGDYPRSPPTGCIGWWWTVLLAKGPAHPDEPQVRLWTGYSWLEAGHEPHIAPDACRIIGDELEPPVGLPMTDRELLTKLAEHMVLLQRLALAGGPVKRNDIRVSKWRVIYDECQAARDRIMAHLAETTS